MNLTTITQRTSPTTTPKNTSHQFRSDAISTSSKHTFSSPTKTRHRHLQPSSSSSSLTSVNSDHRYSSSKSNAHQHRPIPYQNPDFEEVKYHPQRSTSFRDESSQTTEEIPIRKNEREQTDDQFLLDQFSDDSRNFVQAPLDQIKHFYDRTASSRKFLSSTTKMKISEQSSDDFRRKRTDLTPTIPSLPAYDNDLYRMF